MILLLEIARGLAALWVFLFHISDMFETSLPALYFVASYGALGVPMFFVISGYVITHSAESSLRKDKPPLEFLKNRFRRIYPTFWVSVIIVLATPYVIELISFAKSQTFVLPENKLGLLSFSEWLNFLALSKVFYASSSDLQSEFNAINAVYWTLAIEFQFYLVVFLCLKFKTRYRALIAIVSLVTLLNVVLPFGVNYGLFIHYWPAFSVGILLAYLTLNNVKFALKFTHVILAFVAIAIGVVLEMTPRFNSYHLGFALIFGSVLWCIAGAEGYLSKVNEGSGIKRLFLKPWLMLGAMSYSVYLLHAKIYQLPEMFVRQVLESSSPLYSLLTVFVTLVLCYPMYVFVEKRFMSKSHQKLHDVATK